jgi:hypothetical protein
VASTFGTRPCGILLVCQRFGKIAVNIFMVNNFRKGFFSSYITLALSILSEVKPRLDEPRSGKLTNRERQCGHWNIFHDLFSLTAWPLSIG